MQRSAPYTPVEGSCWTGLYHTAGVAAVITAMAIVLGVVAFLVWPPLATASVADWFARFQESWLRGMLDLDLLMLVSNVAAIPIWVAGFVALRRASPSLMALAAPLGLVAAATYFPSSRLFEMAALSSQYAAATTDAQRAMLAAAGQSMLTTYLGTFAVTTAAMPSGWNYQGTAFNVSFVLSALAGILMSVAMLRGSVFEADRIPGPGRQCCRPRLVCAGGGRVAVAAVAAAPLCLVCRLALRFFRLAPAETTA